MPSRTRTVCAGPMPGFSPSEACATWLVKGDRRCWRRCGEPSLLDEVFVTETGCDGGRIAALRCPENLRLRAGRSRAGRARRGPRGRRGGASAAGDSIARLTRGRTPAGRQARAAPQFAVARSAGRRRPDRYAHAMPTGASYSAAVSPASRHDAEAAHGVGDRRASRESELASGRLHSVGR